MHSLLALALLLAPSAHAVPCAAHVEGDRVLLADPLAFAPRLADLAPDSAGPVQGIACLLADQPELVIQVEVHTDSQGSDAYNLRLSHDRAEALRAALLDRGVAPARVTAVGRGETMPVASNQTAEGRAQNRRIELWTDPEGRPPAPVIEPVMVEPPVPLPVEPGPPAPSMCEVLGGNLGSIPQLPGAASCEPSTTGWLCSFAEGPATLAPRVQACVGGQRDGDELYADWRAGTLAVQRDPDRPGRSVVTYIPHIR